MKPERLNEIKKELKSLEQVELVEVCLKLSRFKKDNKEFLSYILFNSENPDEYIRAVTSSLQDHFKDLSPHYYHKAKELRKILRVLTKHIRFIGLPYAEVDLLLWYCHNLIIYAGITPSQKSLYLLLVRQLQKISKIIARLHEDLQFDYNQELKRLIIEATARIKGFKESEFTL